MLSDLINNILTAGIFIVVLFFCAVALYAPLALSAGDKAFVVFLALCAPSAGALTHYFFNQGIR